MSRKSFILETPLGSFIYKKDPIILTPCQTVITRVNTEKKTLGIFPKRKDIAIHTTEDGKIEVKIL